ncbi:uncharacterized protein (DUF427 family) [Rhodococcus sp. OK519]|uniref:DUF427 domain-containing protein n=1 Tax=Rhodococcus sp. OK519 TaxID=2135729 RepID=UPI000D34A0CF|nr:uncharacterized protein (DUF427 family) [Rhodococcus sp. OK519]
MSLTVPRGPLSGKPAPGNFTIDGPAHRLLFDDFPRRVRATYAGETILDTDRGKLLHETGLLPQLYVPETDIRDDLLTPTHHVTYCPFKGAARYWSVTVGGRSAENAVWAYAEPKRAASWLSGYRAFYWESMDGWLDEEESVAGHLRDPYHRVDVRHTGRRVRVLLGSDVIVDTDRAELLSETGLPNRFYVPRDAVGADLLQPSNTTTVCPYKGSATYWTLRLPGRVLDDAAWSYDDPLESALQVRGHVCFDHEQLTVVAEN